MALLLNRKYGSRLECLYYILKSCYQKYGVNKEFTLNGIKFDNNDVYNVHNYCGLLQEKFGIKYCPYLQNPLNRSKCYATQSVESDSTKAKAVSDVGSSLEALGFMYRSGRTILITPNGEKWCNTQLGTLEWEEKALEGALSYGVLTGFLHKANQIPDDTFTHNNIYLGYPKTDESITYTDDNGKNIIINLSTGSTKDSNTRTVTKIIGWCVSVGLIEPVGFNGSITSPYAHIKYREFVNSNELRIRTFRKTDLFRHVVSEKRYVENPLSYSHLNKNVGSLRERGGKYLRKATIEHNDLILNRRFALVYILNKFSCKNLKMDFYKLVDTMTAYKDFFFTRNNDPISIMESESDIAYIAGIPFDIDGNYFIPQTVIRESVLISDASKEIIEIANRIFKKME